MATAPFNEYDVRQLIAAKKFVYAVKQDNTQSKSNVDSEKRIVYDVRRRDMQNKDIRLRLYARVPPSVPGQAVKPTPGVSLQWRKGKIIRKVDYALRHASIQNGAVIGYVRGWHEHIWTDEDEGAYVIAADPAINNPDMRKLIKWAAKKWNIELPQEEAHQELF